MIHLHEEAARCLLCADAPCSKVCKSSDPARAIRAVRFGNEGLAGQWVLDADDAELEAAEKACIHYDQPIRIREIVQALPEPPGQAGGDGSVMANSDRPSLEIDFCGIRCENPFFLASSAVCTNYEMVARAFEAGWAGVFYKTICLQEIREVSPRFDAVYENGRQGDFYGFRNMEQLSENPVEMDFDILKRLKQNYPSKVVVASIMGQKEEEWIELARMAEEAGCDAVELNFSCPQMRLAGMGSDVGQDPELVTFYTAFVKRSVKIPVIPKMTPNIAHISEPAMAAVLGGADAISAINTIKSVTLGEGSEVNGCQTGSGYSGKAVKPIALRHILAMVKNPIISHKELSGVGGIETWRDALEFIQLGCRNVQVCTAVMQYGYRIIDDLKAGLNLYLAEKGFANVEEARGLALYSVSPTTDVLERDSIVFPKFHREKCIGCGRCVISCADGGHQAIRLGRDRKPVLDGKKCVGCHLCVLVCPERAIGSARKRIRRT